MKKEKRGRNREFIIAGVLMILSKNYNIQVSDSQEIDTSLSIGENIEILKNKYQGNILISDLI